MGLLESAVSVPVESLGNHASINYAANRDGKGAGDY
jgi:hypothetical protein